MCLVRAICYWPRGVLWRTFKFELTILKRQMDHKINGAEKSKAQRLNKAKDQLTEKLINQWSKRQI